MGNHPWADALPVKAQVNNATMTIALKHLFAALLNSTIVDLFISWFI